jgi:hypothetical protein
MRGFKISFVVAFTVLAVGVANAQQIVEDFDSQNTGSPPAWLWWNNGTSGTILVDESTSRGASGKSVELVRTVFDGKRFGFGRNFPAIDGPAELTFWWVSVGGHFANAIGTYSDSGGWNQVMNIAPDTWYGVRLEIDPTTYTYDITVWEDGNPGNTATETGIAFRNGSATDTIDQIQFGNFSDSVASTTDYAFVDDITFVGPTILEDGFDSGNTSGWSSSTRPTTQVTFCYQTVTTDAVLAHDLVCDSGAFESVAVELGASNITFDLNGHTISGHPLGIGVRAMDVDAVTVKNGAIEDFLVGMDLVRTDVATVKNLKIGNLVANDPDDFIPGLRITRAQNVLVRDSFFEFVPVAHKEAIVLATSEVTIDNIEMKDGSVGVNISSDNDQSNDGSDATVMNSRFVGVTIAGVLVQCTDTSQVADNEFDRNEMGVMGDADTFGRISGLTLETNSIHDGYYGVIFLGITGSSVLDNVIHDNGWRGISLDSNMGCLFTPPGPECFYSTGNLISGNEATGNFLDLYHRENAVGNTWVGNTCQTKEGVEIPACTLPVP